MADTLIIFVKNPVLGKVKTRLAKSIGDEKALVVYTNLLKITKQTVIDLKINKVVYYSEEVEKDDIWTNSVFVKKVQQGDDLGARMYHAINEEAAEGADKICLIGSDTPDLTEKIIMDAFDLLEHRDVVLGPAHDGGYYLIGMKKNQQALFTDKPWSMQFLLKETLSEIRKCRLSYALLPLLSDIDTVEDIIRGDFGKLMS
jgi:uncharacterized protein